MSYSTSQDQLFTFNAITHNIIYAYLFYNLNIIPRIIQSKKLEMVSDLWSLMMHKTEVIIFRKIQERHLIVHWTNNLMSTSYVVILTCILLSRTLIFKLSLIPVKKQRKCLGCVERRQKF